MLHQNWLVRGDVRLLSVHHSPLDAFPLGAAVLLAGLSHPMCDVDYFMSKLARQLLRKGLFVVQVDPRGHGDSGGEFANVDLDTLREDISIIASYYAQRFPENLLFIGRGLIAPLLAEASAKEHFLGVAGVAPYLMPSEVIRSHLSEMKAVSNDAFEVFPGNDYVGLSDFSSSAISMLDALGVVPYNLHGMRISERMLQQLTEYDAAAALLQADFGRSLWLHDPFSRNPVFQQTVICRLTEWALDCCMMN